MPTTRKILQLLKSYESPNVTFMEPDGSWPIVWERAKGVHVWDADGKKYLDLTAAFGVAATGHANPSVVRAGQKQMATLLHAMGDVHPHKLKAQLSRELSRMTFERWFSADRQLPIANCQSGKSIFCNSGFEAVEAALKTTMLATGKPGVIAFKGAYHGLGYGTLTTTHREHFRSPFRRQLAEFAHFVPFPMTSEERATLARDSKKYSDSCNSSLPDVAERIRTLFRQQKIGAILVEPIQVRGGINIPPKNFLPLLRKLCDEQGALLVLDEIYTGFGRTGKWFACEDSNTAPDLICLGKALTGGFPLSACVGRADLMDAAWPKSTGEAIHTSTFLGHPVGCAMALAQIAEIKKRNLVERSARLGKILLPELQSAIANRQSLTASGAARRKSLSAIGNWRLAVRGQGLLVGVALTLPDGSPATEKSLRAIKEMLRRGFILLPEGEHANVISFTPSLTISETQLRQTVSALTEVLKHA